MKKAYSHNIHHESVYSLKYTDWDHKFKFQFITLRTSSHYTSKYLFRTYSNKLWGYILCVRTHNFSIKLTPPKHTRTHCVLGYPKKCTELKKSSGKIYSKHVSSPPKSFLVETHEERPPRILWFLIEYDKQPAIYFWTEGKLWRATKAASHQSIACRREWLRALFGRSRRFRSYWDVWIWTPLCWCAVNMMLNINQSSTCF